MGNLKGFLWRPRRHSRRRRTGGAELIEFTLTLFPLLMFVTWLVSTGWAFFTTSALQYAVRVGARTGITLNKTTVGSSNLTTYVKNLVVQNSFGFLKDTSLVHVHYYQPPAAGSSGPVTDVSTVTTGAEPGNYPGHIMVVSIDGYSLPPLMVRIFAWNRIDKSPSAISVSSADLIEPMDTTDLPPIGTAP